MARVDTLSHFLSDVAGAIRQQTKKSDLIPANEFDTEILSIGGVTPTPLIPKDVNFYDYDGTLLYSYTKEEFKTLTNMPELPQHEGLICEGWNWDFENISTQGYICDIGATYRTDDGKTRIYIRLPKNNLTVNVCFEQVVKNTVEIDWGDGSPIQTSKTIQPNMAKTSHIYSTSGDYVIKLYNTDLVNNMSFRNQTYGGYGTVSILSGLVENSYIYKLEIGSRVAMIYNNFANLRNVESITIPSSWVTESTYSSVNIGGFFGGCTKLKAAILPKGVKYIPTRSFADCISLQTISIPYGVLETYSDATFRCCFILKRLIIPITSITAGTSTSDATGTLQYARNLEYLTIPPDGSGVVKLPYVSDINNIHDIIIYGPVTSVGSFSNAWCAKIYDFSRCVSVPTLSNANNIPTNYLQSIIVPASLYNEWIATSGWSSLAQYIVPDENEE